MTVSLPRHSIPDLVLDHLQMAAERPLFQIRSLARPRSLNTGLLMKEWVDRLMDLVANKQGFVVSLSNVEFMSEN